MSAQTHQKRTPMRFEPLHPSRIPVPSSRRQASIGLPISRSTRTAKTPRSRLMRPSEALLDLSLAQSPFAVSYYPEAPQVDYSPPIPSDPTFATTELSGASSATTTTGADHEPLPASPPELTRSAIQRILPEPCFSDTSTPLRLGAWLHTRPDSLATTGLAIEPNTRPLAHSPTPDDGSNLSNDAKYRLPASQAAELSGCPTSNTSNDRHATPGLSEPSYRGCSLVPKQSTATTLTTSLHLLSMMGGDDPHLLAADKSTTLPAPLSMSMVRSSTPISSPLEADALDPFDMSDIPMLKASSTESLHAAAPKPIVTDTCLTIDPAPLPDQHPTAEESQSHYTQAVSELPLICLSEMPTKATTLEFFTPRSGLPPARGHSANRADSPMEQPDLLTTSLLKTPSSYLPPLLLAPVLRSPELRPNLLSATESPDQSCEATPATVPTLASLATSNTPNPNVLHCTLSSLQTTSEQVLYQISQTQSLVTQQIRASLAGPTLHRQDIASPSPAPGSPTSPHQPLAAAATSSRNDPFSPSHLDGLVAAMDQVKQRLAASSREISHLRRHIEHQQRLEVKLDRQIARANETIATRQLQLQDEQLSQFLNTELVVHHVCSPLTIPASVSPIRRNDQRGNGEESGGKTDGNGAHNGQHTISPPPPTTTIWKQRRKEDAMEAWTEPSLTTCCASSHSPGANSITAIPQPSWIALMVSPWYQVYRHAVRTVYHHGFSIAGLLVVLLICQCILIAALMATMGNPPYGSGLDSGSPWHHGWIGMLLQLRRTALVWLRHRAHEMRQLALPIARSLWSL